MSTPVRSAKVVIRRAKPAGREFLQHAETRAFKGDRISQRAFARLIRSASADVLVCECGGAPAGYAIVLFRCNSRSARLYSIAVLPAFSGQRLGTALLVAAEAVATAREAADMRLEVRPDNAAALRLYRRSGYRPAGSKPRYYHDGVDAHCFRKSFAAAQRQPAMPAIPAADIIVQPSPAGR